MEFAETQITLDSLLVGSRLLVRSKTDWRHACVSKHADEKVVLTVCSPSGRTYRIRRALTSEISLNGPIPVLIAEYPDDWHSNFSSYDSRW
ncbi:MAG: hypothetical protein KA746_05545 [Pyrinomonadaceae bacterium]|nr:hypothetical protein [Pyrinomonadaceae bacterium]MBP6212736.1 hypothetical protein [Pyrinomonadaceae bacterium]